MEYSYELKIPRDRIAVLIGKKGEIKSQLEEETKTKIKVDSDEGDVTISGDDALNLYTTREMIKAVGRGFNPDIAKLLLKQDYCFEAIMLADYGKTKNDFERLKGRVIGTEGKCRKLIENLTETYISVYGKTISIIGETENATIARRAVDSLLKGSTHSTVYRFLEKQRSQMKRKNYTREKEFEENLRHENEKRSPKKH